MTQIIHISSTISTFGKSMFEAKFGIVFVYYNYSKAVII